jgi:hypothetical protein
MENVLGTDPRKAQAEMLNGPDGLQPMGEAWNLEKEDGKTSFN